MFRLLYFESSNHPVLKDVKISFTGNDDLTDTDDIYTSVFIGQNGTGKSEILSYVSSIFRAIDNYKRKVTPQPEIDYRFTLIYRMDSDIYEISPSRFQVPAKGGRKSYESISYYKNKKSDNSISKKDVASLIKEDNKYKIKIESLPLPDRILVSSIMLTDKFNSKSTESYFYLGIRNEGSPQVAGTKAYIRRTVEFIIRELQSAYFLSELKRLLYFLELEESLLISYIPRYRNIFMTGNMTVDKFHDSFTNWETTFTNRKEHPWGYGHYQKIKEDTNLILEIVDFLNNLSNKLDTYGSRGKLFSYNILNDSDIANDFEMIKQLNWLNLVSSPSISIKKKEIKDSYNIERSSSGEAHMVTTIIGLLASIKQNSIVFIDEPEISLHPNWQMKYINHLKDTFKNYTSCHFLIATHSHFMISDLNPTTSNVIALYRDEERKLHAESIEANTYGWSVDEILYKVFRVRSTRNMFFENKLRELAYTMTRDSENKQKLTELLHEIEPYSISTDDPLNKLVQLAKELI